MFVGCKVDVVVWSVDDLEEMFGCVGGKSVCGKLDGLGGGFVEEEEVGQCEFSGVDN